MHFNIFVLFIVDTTSILTLVFPTIYYFCLDGYIGGCVVAIIVTVVVVFIYLFYLFILFFVYLFIFSAASTVILIFVVVVVIATAAFVVGVIVAFCACWVIVVANLMLFPMLVLLFVPYFTVNSVGK